MVGVREIALVLLIGWIGWAYKAMQPPPPRICGKEGGLPVTAPRVKLRDGRHLAYIEHGVPREAARFKIIFVHGFLSTKSDSLFATEIPPEVIEELGVYSVSFDRPGYGESDPDPKRTPKSLALDVEELADHLGLGSKFYIIGLSMGGQAVWGCLKYIPHRLAGATLIAPVANYWWPGFPADLSTEAYYLQLPQDQWALRVAHYTPWLVYWWNTQKWFPASSVIARRREIFSQQDLELLPKVAARNTYRETVIQQGEFESLHRDMMIGFGRWEFDPMDIENPFPNNESSVHLWHGDDDRLVPASLQRFTIKRLSWIHHHEVPGAGHLLPSLPGMSETIMKALILGEK
uniref:Catalytic n=1 Tax=Rhizophora mucronata TaxID=61149 RepID=A0A2P2JJ79_RHIMU